jgi:hypothetical protein
MTLKRTALALFLLIVGCGNSANDASSGGADGSPASDGGDGSVAAMDALATADARVPADAAARGDGSCDPEGGFGPERRFNGGVASQPYLLVADLNGDGRMDMAIADEHADALIVRLGNGDGTFKPSLTYATGPTPLRIATGDLNRDGHPDIVTANNGAFDYATHTFSRTGLSVFLGHGDGSFAPAVEYLFSDFPDGGALSRARGVAIGDVNGDGLPDLAAVGGDDRVAVWLGAGGGAFSPRASYPAGITNVVAVAAGDVNGDGRADIAVGGMDVRDGGAGNAGTVAMLLSTGSGLSAPAVYPAGASNGVNDVVIADLDGDGHPEVTAATTYWTGLGVMRGHGDGTFDAMVGYPGAGYAYSVRIGDLNGDGRLDMAVGTGYGVTVLTQTTTGAFQALVVRQTGGPGQGVTFSTSFVASSGEISGAISVGIGDLDGDGVSDVAAGVGQYDVMVFHNTGDGHLQNASPLHHDLPGDLAAADFNGDGRLDLVVSNWGTLDLGMLLGNGDGTFQPEVDHPLGEEGCAPAGLVAADLNLDGKPDLVVETAGSGSTSDHLTFFLGQDGGSLQRSAASLPGPYGKPIVGDWNGDGIPDLAAQTNRLPDGGVTEVLGNYVGVATGNGDGTFVQGPIYSAADGVLVQAVATADLNGDGRADLVAVCSAYYPGAADTLSVSLGNGDGTFAAAVPYVLHAADSGVLMGGAMGVGAGDVNGDGHPDVVVWEMYPDDVAVLLGHGDGTLGEPSFFQVTPALGGIGVPALVLGDFNGDGRLDVAISHNSSTAFRSAVGILFGNGDGTFQSIVNRDVGGTSAFLVAGRFAGGSRPDLVVANEGTNDLSYLPNEPSCALGP